MEILRPLKPIITLINYLTPRYLINGYKIYGIRSGKHRSTMGLCITKSKKIEFSCIFNNNCEYYNIDKVNQHDVNKLYGLSDRGTLHSRNSVRFGWRWYNNKIDILSYVRTDGEFKFTKICNVKLGESNDYSIEIKEDSYIFRVGKKMKKVDKDFTYDGYRYYLYPYFGGNETAPHDMTIKIKEI